MPKKIEFRKVRSFGEIINTTIEFVRNNFKALYTPVVLIAGPFMLASAIASALFISNMYDFTDPSSMDVLDPYGGFNTMDTVIDMYFPWGVIFGFLSIVSYAAMTAVSYKYVQLYVASEDGEVKMSDLTKSFGVDLLWVFGATLLFFIALFLGLMLCVLPGVFFAIAMSVMYAVHFEENLGIIASFNRSWELIKGNWWNTFLIVFILGILVGMLSSVFAIPQVIFQTMSFANPENLLWKYLYLGMNILSTLLSLFLYVIYNCGLATWYYSLVEQKEAVGAMNQIDQFGDGTLERDMFR